MEVKLPSNCENKPVTLAYTVSSARYDRPAVKRRSQGTQIKEVVEIKTFIPINRAGASGGGSQRMSCGTGHVMGDIIPALRYRTSGQVESLGMSFDQL